MRGSVLLALLVLLAVSAGSAAMQGTATLSGTITHAGGPVAGMPVLVVWDGGGVETVSGADGTYQAAGLPVGGWAHIHIFAPPAFGLAGINHRIEPITGDMVVNFELVAGHQLRGQLRLPDGSPLRQPVWVGANPTVFTLPEGEWLGTTYDPESGFFEVMLPPDVYTLTLPSELRPLALPPTQIDLRDGAVTDLIVTLVEAGEVERFPTEPPRAELIHVSAPDADGTSAVTGEPGAVAPLSSVFLGNLSAHTFATTLADAEGGFSASLYLPPGSALLVKYGFGEGIRLLQRSADLGNVPDGDDLNELPGTIITVGGRLPGDERSQAFDAVRLNLDENSGSGWTGWWLSGTVSTPGGRSAHGLALQRGESGQVSARIRITTPDYPCTDPVPYTPRAHLNLHLAFHADGRAAYWGMWFTAQLFTPTGLPIEAESFGLWRPIGE
ncbi:MAG: carboxypeptidase regulatory-like domain-containing protein, partial [Anaerolineae bacterium]|nr:carboxypeptidase regulatory-like domain-containing protein [Anaerolineae bacterium]